MKKILIGLVDYGAGNCASVRNIVSRLGFRSRLVNRSEDFSEIDMLIIPGVGAFPSAMQALVKLDLVGPIQAFAHSGKPLIGVCLGMQMLADRSFEMGETAGLGLIPGDVTAISEPLWHIGWNTLESKREDPIANSCDGLSFYFNHSFQFEAPEEYVTGVARFHKTLVSVVLKQNVLGFQFHPEKSQTAGSKIMQSAIQELTRA